MRSERHRNFVVLPLTLDFCTIIIRGKKNPISFPPLMATYRYSQGQRITETNVGAIRNSRIYGGDRNSMHALGIAVSYNTVRSSFGKSFETLAISQ